MTPAAVPVGVALAAGALATLNPCAFPLLPAFLSFYVGADDARLPAAPNRAAQGLLVGLLVTTGFLGVFAAVGLPAALGVGAITEAVPWAGLAIGLALAAAGLYTLAGGRLRLPTAAAPQVPGDRRASTMLLFGVGYGAASLGCTLPVFLTLLGASASAGGVPASLMVFGAYGVGMAVTLTALSVAAALLRQGLARGLRRLLPYAQRLSGGLLAVAGAYLTYFWARVTFGSSAALGSDPLVRLVLTFTARLEALAQRSGAPLVIGAG
ncbi:MAG: cytochrome c biogenesis CcdA family protein, partial [Gemmatimonadales bacterium]